MKTLTPLVAAISKKTGRRIVPIEMDMGDLPSIRPTVQTVVQEFGCLNILVNNAGINSRIPATEYTEEAWD
jgi:NAD(P)-dependent dehydrogenase (short-subunit alcohol dehydrogenase family)